MNNNNLFSTRLNELLNSRKPKKIKKIELAEQLFVTPQTVSRWCNGVIIPDRGTIELITKKINEMYGFSENSNQRFRSEYLAGEDKIKTYDFVSPEILEYVNSRKRKDIIKINLKNNIYDIINHLGYSPNAINDKKHFLDYIYAYIEIGIQSYMDNINSTIRKDEKQ